MGIGSSSYIRIRLWLRSPETPLITMPPGSIDFSFLYTVHAFLPMPIYLPLTRGWHANLI